MKFYEDEIEQLSKEIEKKRREIEKFANEHEYKIEKREGLIHLTKYIDPYYNYGGHSEGGYKLCIGVFYQDIDSKSGKRYMCWHQNCDKLDLKTVGHVKEFLTMVEEMREMNEIRENKTYKLKEYKEQARSKLYVVSDAMSLLLKSLDKDEETINTRKEYLKICLEGIEKELGVQKVKE